MCLEQDIRDKYVALRVGEEIYLAELVEKCSTGWIYKSNVKLDHQLMCIISMKNHEEYNSLVLSVSQPPVVTKATSSELLESNHHSTDEFKLTKKILDCVYGQKQYLYPHMSSEHVIAPLEGESKGNVDYINVLAIDRISKFSEYQTVISFCNDLDIIVPKSLSCVEKRLERYLQHFVSYHYINGLVKEDESGSGLFSQWQGSYFEGTEELVNEAIWLTQQSKKEIDSLKSVYALLKCHSPEEINTLIDDFYDNK